MRVWTGVCRRWVILVFLSFMGWLCVGMDACGVEGGRLLPPRGGNAVVEFSAEEGINVSGELSAFRGKRGEGGEIPVRPLSDSQALEIGRRIWQNECAGTIEGLTAWNEGEGFVSLGIGHFIWYPEGKDGPFRESFPEFVGFLLRNGGYVPEWVVKARGCPWPDRKAFLAS
ncbi:MAG: hypothetical protein NZL93_06745, partial [Chthoniobacterales bacterium]|nr:hypothetical protein [Chthoniobacterales bacterium]